MIGKKEIVRQFVARAVFIRNSSVLLANKKGENHFFLPGGRVEIGEGVTHALIREIKEELNSSCVIKKYIGSLEHAFDYTDNKSYYEVGHFFEVNIVGVDLIHPKSAEEEMQFKWIKISELQNIDIRPKPLIDLLKKIDEGKIYSAFWASTLVSMEK